MGEVSAHNKSWLTAFSRAEIIRRVLFEGRTLPRAASVCSISVRTVRKWLRRYREEGDAGPENRNSRPHNVVRHRPTR
jgi:transposase